MSSLSRSHFFVDFHQTEHIHWGQYRPTPSPNLPLKSPFSPRSPENPCKYEKRNICLKCSRIAKILASYRISNSGNRMVSSDFWSKVEIWPFRACAMKNMQFGTYLWPNRQSYSYYSTSGDVIFLTGSRNMAVSRMHNEKICNLAFSYGRIPKIDAQFSNGLVNSAIYHFHRMHFLLTIYTTLALFGQFL